MWLYQYKLKTIFPVAFVFILFLLALNLNYGLKIKSDLGTISFERFDNEPPQCSMQWTELNSELYFRPHMTYYYTDLERLDMNFLVSYKHKDQLNLRATLKVRVAGYPSFNHSLTNFTLTQKGSYDRYLWFQMTKKVSLSNIIAPTLVYKDLHSDVEVKVSVSNRLNGSTQYDIPVRVKKSFYNGTEDKVIMCGKVYYLPATQEKNFQFWAGLSRYQGYEKMVIFLNSLEYTPTFEQTFSAHKYFIEILPYQCLPNFYTDTKAGSPKFFDFNYMKTHLGWDPLLLHNMFERMTQNECYWENMDKYRHIAVMDNDESVIPRILDNQFEKDHQQRDVTIKKLLESESECEANHDMLSYFIKLKDTYRNNSKYDYLKLNGKNPVVTYHFLMTLYAQYDLVDLILDKIAVLISPAEQRQILSNIIRVPIQYMNDQNFKQTKGLNFTIVIADMEDLVYARHLIRLWRGVIKPFIGQNTNVFDTKLTFNRLFFFTGTVTSGMCGKSIHDTRSTVEVMTHYPIGAGWDKDMLWVPQKHYYLSHFRNSLKDIHLRNISIADFQFDYNYFVCYFAPLIKKMKYSVNY